MIAPRVSFLRRALWHANRTPFAPAIKALVSLFHRRDARERANAARMYARGGKPLERAKQLHTKGCCLVTDLVDRGLLGELERESLARLNRADDLARQQQLTHKGFWVRLLDSDMIDGAFDCDSIFVQFALQPAVLAVLANRLNQLPRLADVLLTYSTPSEDTLSYSQLWHRDFDDVRTIKLFSYLTDVTDVDDGPFTYMPGPYSDRIGFTLRSHLPDAEFFSRAPRSGVEQVRGPRLSVFLCETSRCYHMGSRVADGHSRLMYTATFISSPSVYPAGQPRFRATRPLSTAQRLLLGV